MVRRTDGAVDLVAEAANFSDRIVSRSSFDNVKQVVRAISTSSDGWHDGRHTFTWTKTADETPYP
jgi:hypothetical protein